IINLKDVGLIASWIDKRRMTYHFTNLPFKFMLIYRASRDGEIIGGYNPLEWCRIKTEDERSALLPYNIDFDHQCRASNSFIFSLTNQAFPILSRISSKKEAIIWSKNTLTKKKLLAEKFFEIEEYEVFQIIDERYSQYIN
ncbi:14991_t:CDS:2, partial [Gigaspora rosea]